MISSAVIIPEPEPEQNISPPSLKRRQYSDSPDSNKRPRLDTQNGEYGSRGGQQGPVSPSGKRRSVLGTGAAEEKKRGQRLFGALLGTLSQTSSKPAHRKRDEIEQRQRERARKDTEEREEALRRKREELEKVRRVEQKAWDKESMRIRHRNMRAVAGFLQTKAEPRLYYKPWELREEEDEQIRRQIRDVEDKIKIELGETNAREDPVRSKDRDTRSVSLTRDVSRHDTMDHQDKDLLDDDKVDSGPNNEGDAENEDAMKIDDAKENGDHLMHKRTSDEDRQKDDDHAGEELVEGQEDDVIY